MGFWQRLIGSDLADESNTRSLLPELLESYREEVRLARQMREHAELAPHQAGAQGLRMVAEEQDRLVQLLGDKIIALGGETNAPAGPSKGGKNHWARVVQDLADNVALGRHYNERAIYYDPAFPEVAELFRTLEQGKNRISALLRDLAVRADPHALD
jgi:hypothetical protein